MERIYGLMMEEHLLDEVYETNDISVMALCKEAMPLCFDLTCALRAYGFKVDMLMEPKGIKQQFKRAERKNSDLALIVGEDELAKREVIVRNFKKQIQASVALEDVMNVIQSFFTELEEMEMNAMMNAAAVIITNMSTMTMNVAAATIMTMNIIMKMVNAAVDNTNIITMKTNLVKEKNIVVPIIKGELIKMERTHYNGTLTLENVGESVVLVGWVSKRRNLGSIVFIDLRDRSGIVQILVDPEKLILKMYVMNTYFKYMVKSQKKTLPIRT